MAPLAVPDIGNIGHPLEVCWDGIKADKKPREQKHWDGSNWPHKSGHLGREGIDSLLPRETKANKQKHKQKPTNQQQQPKKLALSSDVLISAEKIIFFKSIFLTEILCSVPNQVSQ